VNILGEILKGVTGPVADYFNDRQRIKAEDRAGERELKRAQLDRKIELTKAGLTADMSWEMEFARQAASSWKDEYTLLITSIPVVLCFIPGGAKYVHDGFSALGMTPLWYQGLVLSLFLASVGIRYWRRKQYDTE